MTACALQLKNARAQTPLAVAVQFGNYDLCKLYLENGALVESSSNAGQWNLMDSIAFYNIFAEGKDLPGLFAEKGLKPKTIHQAAGVGDLNLVKELLADGTSPKKCKDRDAKLQTLMCPGWR